MKRKSKKLLAWSLVVAMVITQLIFTNVSFAATSPARLSGNDRYQTAIEISKTWTSSDVAVIAYGEDFPDALSAAPLAKKFNAPILLTQKDTLTSGVLAELQRLGVKTVYIVGGTGVVSQGIADSLTAANMQVTRLSGADRYATALKVAQEVGNNGTVVVAYGENYPDALSISSIAALKGWPILLTDKNAMDPAVKAFIGQSKAYVVGGTGAVSDAVLNGLANGERISGTDRYATNVAVMTEFAADYDWSNVYVAYGENFPDALAGSAAAAYDKAPVVLVGSTMPAATEAFVDGKVTDATQVIALGGSSVVSNTAVAAIGTTTTTTPPPATGTDVVSVTAANQPAGALVYTGTAQNEVFRFQVKTGSNAFDASAVTLKQYNTASGNAADISRVYLVDNGTVLTSGVFNNGTVRLNKQISVPANTTKNYSVVVDVANAATPTAVIQIGIDDATAFDSATTVQGTFPMMGNNFSISAASVGRLTTGASTQGATVAKIGDVADNLGNFTLTANNTESINVNKITLTGNGLAPSNFANLYLYKTNGTAKIDVKGVVNGNTITFDLSGSPVQLTPGASDRLYLKGDVVSGLNDNGVFQIANGFDVVAKGVSSNANVVTTLGATPQPLTTANVTVNAGNVQLAVSTASPAAGSTVLATSSLAGTIREFTLLSPGEDMVINSMNVNVTTSGPNLNAVFGSFYLYDGDTGMIIAGPVAAPATASGTAVTFNDVNYYVKAGVTKKIQVRATRVANDATIDVQIPINGLSYTLQTSQSNQTLPAGALGGGANKAFANAGSVTVSADATTPVTTAPLGGTGVSLAKYLFTTTGADDVQLRQITLSENAGRNLKGVISNVGAYVNGTLYGVNTVQPTDDNGGFIIDLSSNPINIAKSSTVEVEIKGDVVGNILAFQLNCGSYSALSKTTSLAATMAGAPVAGGAMAIGATTLRETLPSYGQTVPGNQLGNADVTFAKFKLVTGLAEGIDLKQVRVNFAANGGAPAAAVTVKGVKIMDGDKVIGTYPAVAVPDNGNINVDIPITTDTQIAANASKTLSVVAQMDDDSTVSGRTITVSVLSNDANIKGTGLLSNSSIDATSNPDPVNVNTVGGIMTKVDALATIALDSDSPSGSASVVPGATLMKFSITGNGKLTIPAGNVNVILNGTGVAANFLDDASELALYRGATAATQLGTSAVGAGAAGNRNANIAIAAQTIANGETATFWVKYQGGAFDPTNPWSPAINTTITASVTGFPITDGTTTVRTAAKMLSGNTLRY